MYPAYLLAAMLPSHVPVPVPVPAPVLVPVPVLAVPVLVLAVLVLAVPVLAAASRLRRRRRRRPLLRRSRMVWSPYPALGTVGACLCHLCLRADRAQ
jgi:hypothetical protein